jgi:hypothetical protein
MPHKTIQQIITRLGKLEPMDDGTEVILFAEENPETREITILLNVEEKLIPPDLIGIAKEMTGDLARLIAVINLFIRAVKHKAKVDSDETPSPD